MLADITHQKKRLIKNLILVSVLGSEYCSGYMDSIGKWNNGFYCPGISTQLDNFQITRKTLKGTPQGGLTHG